MALARIESPSSEPNRPYPPPSNIISLLHRLRSRNLPDRVDSEYLRDAGIPDSLINRSLFALRFLGLTEPNDAPTPALRSIATSTDEEYRDILAGLIRESYAEVFASVDPAEDAPDRIVNVFRRYSPASQRERMVSFFLAMCREAGIPTLEVPRQRTGKASGTRTPKSRPATGRNAKAPAKTAITPDEGVRDMGGIPPHLELLIRALPPAGQSMSAARREQWLTMAGSVLAFTYPETDEEAEGAEGDNDMT